MLSKAYDLWKNEIPELKNNTNPVEGLYKLYVRMHKEIETEKALNPEGESPLEKEGKRWFQKLEAHDPDAVSLWDWSLNLSLKEFQQVYDLLGVNFEYMLGESQFVGMIPSVIRAFTERKIAATGDDQSTTVHFADEKLGKLVIKKSDGTSLYSTRDLATLAARTEWFKPEKILYVVGGEQQHYFHQVFDAFDQLTDSKAPELQHIRFGMMSLLKEKISTRRGNVVFLADVLDESKKRVKDKIETRKSNQFSEDEVDEISRQVGVGAVIYFDLGQTRLRNIKFDWDAALSYDGNSAPYIQYAHTRAKSILRKAEEANSHTAINDAACFELPVEQELIKHLSRFPLAITEAVRENEPSIIAEHTYKTADLFNQFYKQTDQTPIIKDQNQQRKVTRLRLTAASAQVIKNGLYLLGIEAPERM